MRNCSVLRAWGIDSLAREGAAMPAEELVRVCLDELRESDPIGRKIYSVCAKIPGFEPGAAFPAQAPGAEVGLLRRE